MKRCCDPVTRFQSIIEEIMENVSNMCNSNVKIIDEIRSLDNSNKK